MRLLAGLTGMTALIALSTAPAIAECNWGKMADSKAKMSTMASMETAPSTAIATNDLDELVIKQEDAKARPPQETETPAE